MRAKPIRSSYFLDRIADARERVETAPNTVSADLRDLVLEVAAESRTAVSFSAIEAKLVAAATVDRDALESAVKLLDAVPARAFGLRRPSGHKLSKKRSIERLTKLVTGLETPEKLDPMEVILRLGMIGDGEFDALLTLLKRRVSEVDAIRSLVRKKLELIDDARLLNLWGHYRAETSVERENRIELAAPIASPSFLDSVAVSQMRDRIADYLSWVRPQCERQQLLAGQTRLPADYIGIARILSWTPMGVSGGELSTEENGLARAVARLAVWWGPAERAMLANAFGVSVEGPMLAGRTYLEATKLAAELGVPSGALDELRQLVRLVHGLATNDSPISRALRAYKLGLEVAFPRVEFSDRDHEVHLQRHLCRFLVERNIWATGTKFGRSEPDVRAEDAFDVYVIEANRLRGAANDRDLKANASQLLRYMDVEPMHRCGVLALYNFSRVPIVAPPTFLRGRLYVLPINLCPNSPSDTPRSLLIEEPTTHDELFRVITVESIKRTPPRASRSRNPKKRVGATRR